ncbi:MAG: lamin tail domain-containing protein [Chloroflexota bacterium]
MFIRKFGWLLTTLFLLLAMIIVGCGVPASGDQVRTELITVEVIITATPDPNVTPNVIIVTATTDRTQVAVPDDIVPDTDDEDGGSTQLSGTQIAASSSEDTEDDNGVPSSCLIHIVEDGDSVFGIAEIYGVDPFIMLNINGFTEETAFLNIGDELVVPVEGCPIEDLLVTQVELTEEAEATAEFTEESTAEATEPAQTFTPSPSPTITLPPVATDSEIEIVEVIRPGDVTAEGVRIRNNGRLVDIDGWTLADSEGNEYTFVDKLIFEGGEYTIYTRSGQDVPAILYWGLEEDVWEIGDVVTLSDADGEVQATFRVEEESSAP